MTRYAANKFGNVKTNGYHSKREAKRAAELKALQLAGEINVLMQQYEFTLIPAQYKDGKCIERACKYIADFVYEDSEGRRIVEDVKGMKTPAYIIKRKLLLYVHGIQVREV